MEIAEKVKTHLKSLYEKKSFDGDLSYEQLLENWAAKEALFNDQIQNLKMVDADSLSMDQNRAVLGLSFSGSLLALYCPEEKGRALEYASIKMRSDVPDLIKDDEVLLVEDIRKGAPVRFSKGKLEHSSPLYRVVITPEDLNPSEQNRRLSEAMIFLSNGFLKLNRATFHSDESGMEHFTKRNMISYLAKKYGMTQQITRDLIEDYLTMMETGILMGETLTLGRMGRLRLKKKNSQKARVIKSPLDGSEITVPAKPPVMIPRVSFSDYFKDRAANLPVDEE